MIKFSPVLEPSVKDNRPQSTILLKDSFGLFLASLHFIEHVSHVDLFVLIIDCILMVQLRLYILQIHSKDTLRLTPIWVNLNTVVTRAVTVIWVIIWRLMQDRVLILLLQDRHVVMVYIGSQVSCWPPHPYLRKSLPCSTLSWALVEIILCQHQGIRLIWNWTQIVSHSVPIACLRLTALFSRCSLSRDA